MFATGIVDLQWFTSSDPNNRIIVKELSVANLNRQCEEHYLFDAPTKLMEKSAVDVKLANWQTRFFHNLSWSTGDIQYHRLPKLLELINQTYNLIYVKGLAKKTFLSKFLSVPIVNIEDYGCPRLVLLKSNRHCLRNHPNCTVTNVDKITSWLRLFTLERGDY